MITAMSPVSWWREGSQAWLHMDRGLQYLSIAVLALGFVAMSSASVEYAADRYGSPFFFMKRYGFYLVLATVFALSVYLVPMRLWERYSGLCLLFGLVLLSLVLIPGIGREVNGSRRWLVIGPLTLQVSEFVKLFVVFYMAGYLVRRRDEVQERLSGFLKPMLVVFVVTLLLMMEPDFGATVVTAGTTLVLLFLGGVKLWQFMGLVLSGVAALVLMVVISPYRMQRVTAYTDPFAHQFDSGYQLVQSLIAFGRGEWFGVGLGNSVQKLFYLPEAHTDFVFAVYAEEFGFVGACLALALFAMLIARMLRIGQMAEQAGLRFQAYVAWGIAIIFAGQVFINVGVTTGLLPTKGLTLPLWSYGGSSLMVSLAMLAIVGRVYREAVEAKS